MCRVLMVCIGVVAIAAPSRGSAAEEASRKPSFSWSIEKVVRCQSAQPSALRDKPSNDAGAKYLHVYVVQDPSKADVRLHRFRLTDERGKTVAELYGFHQGHSVLVFEGGWSRLEGLYVEGAGHREPLIAAPSSPRRTGANEAPNPKPAEPEPTVVMPRRPSKPAKFEGVEREPPAAPEPEPGEMHSRQEKSAHRPTAEKPAESRKLYQEVLVAQRTRVNIQGLDFDGDLQYRVLSSLAAGPRNADGGLSVAQKVEEAEVLKADPLTQSIVAGLLGNLVGTTFQMTVGPDGRVINFQGVKGRIRAAVDSNPLSGQSFLMASIIDPDGWREIAGLTFFQPPAASTESRAWDRAVAHSWGPLGRWSGKVAYVHDGQDGSTHRFRYTFRLNYEAPKTGAGGLPFQIVRADFKHQEAGGTIAFDTAKGRVVQAQERFPVKGSLTIGLLGQENAVTLDETQDFRVRILDRRPASAQ